MFKKGVVSLLIVIFLLSSMVIYATDETDIDNETDTNRETDVVFSDVSEDKWYYDAVMTMSEYGIIEGYGDGTFRPEKSVSREEFATIMVKALKLELVTPQSSFTDVTDSNWASKYIETAKTYLTGFLKNGDYIFKPKADAVREDMAVALVNALGKSVRTTDLSILDSFEDEDEINDNLRGHVASAINNDLMTAQEVDGKKYFNPLDTLTRAEAAALLLTVVEEEKIVFNSQDKVVIDNSELTLDIITVEGGLKLAWDYESSKEVSGYKIVASITDETPVYPENGNAKYVQGDSSIINNDDAYNGKEFTNFMAGETYYFSVAALVGDEYVTSNVVKATMPAVVSLEGKVPEVRVSQVGSGIVVEWNEINKSGLESYRVVASKSDSTPVYPYNGFAVSITDLDTYSYLIEPGTIYKDGDLDGKFNAGERYYISVTAVYESGKIAGNTVTYIMPGEPTSEDDTPAIIDIEKKPIVKAVVLDGKLIIEWSDISMDGLESYKVVASKSNPNPIYSEEDGFAKWETDLSTHRIEIKPDRPYNGGDLDGSFKSGERYYVSVTAVYSDGNVAGNAVQITMP